MLGLATFSFLILIYLFRVVLSLLLMIAVKIFKGKYNTRKIYKIISKDLFFNYILAMSIEGLIDFIIFGYLNIITAEFTINGEKLGFGFGLFSLTTSGFILPITIVILLFKTKID